MATAVTARRTIRAWLFEEIYTWCVFWTAVATLPALTISYLVVRVSKHLWLKLLSSRYPGLEFIRTDTVRSLLDTHRNQGIINVLLSVKDRLNVEQIKQQLIQHVIERRDKNSGLMFPRLRHLLVSCWGNYAWDTNVLFKTENHFIIANSVYRGRPVTDNNIQDYVSEIVSKYFPSDQPPWQYIIIPCASTEPKYFILVRVHHLFLTGKKSINIGDLLMMEQIKQNDYNAPEDYTKQSPLANLFPAPSAIPELWQKINENLSNAWNEYISEYDPVESPRALKTLPGIFHVAGLLLISTVTALKQLTKKQTSERGSHSSAPITATTLLAAIQQECKRRNLTILKMMISPLVTADPRKWPRLTFRLVTTTTTTFFKLPFRVRDELAALLELHKTGHVSQPDTMTWKYSGLAQLSTRAIGEAWCGLVEVYRAPAEIWTDTVGTDVGPRHILQTVSLCGRKVVAWSRPVSRAGVERAARALGISSTDVALFAATEALRAFFEQTQNCAPEHVLITARAAPEDFMFTFAEGDGKMYKKSQTGGMVCLSLPIGGTPRRIASVVEQSCSRQRVLAAAWALQARYGALTRAVPSPFARLTLNLLSRRYAVSYAEIDAPVEARARSTLWGQAVDYVVYWRPPQANISMSLTVIQYADTVRLAVMTDARLSPAHTFPATRWPNAIEQLVAKVDQEIARIAAQSLQPDIIQPLETPEVKGTESESSIKMGESSQSLKPPATTAVSPPPLRRRITHH